MHAVEFESDILGDTVQIPDHVLSQISACKHVKIILLLPDEAKTISKINLKDEILKIGKNCASLPLLDKRSPNEILGYNNIGLPK